MRRVPIYQSGAQDDLECFLRALHGVDPDLHPTLVKVLDGGLRLAVRFSREVEAAELVEAGVVEIDEDAGYVTASPTE